MRHFISLIYNNGTFELYCASKTAKPDKKTQPSTSETFLPRRNPVEVEKIILERFWRTSKDNSNSNLNGALNFKINNSIHDFNSNHFKMKGEISCLEHQLFTCSLENKSAEWDYLTLSTKMWSQYKCLEICIYEYKVVYQGYEQGDEHSFFFDGLAADIQLA